MSAVFYNDVWEELKYQDEESLRIYETSEELSRIILELIEARVERGFSQRDLAAKCGLKQSAIARMESLKTIPRIDTIIKVACALKLKVCFEQTAAKVSSFSVNMSFDQNDNDYHFSSDFTDAEYINTGAEYEIAS